MRCLPVGIWLFLTGMFACSLSLAGDELKEKVSLPNAWKELKLSEDKLPLSERMTLIPNRSAMLEEVVQAVVTIQVFEDIDPESDVEVLDPIDQMRKKLGLPPLPDLEVEKNVDKPKKSRRLIGIGSGSILTESGYILSNHHVVDSREAEADLILVETWDGRLLEATVVAADSRTDVAIVKVDGSGLSVLSITDSERVRVGDTVFAVGIPLGVGMTVTSGIVSAVARSDLNLSGVEGMENFIQVDAPINKGNSGGPLLDEAGRLIGMNTAIVSHSGGNIGLGFAIPINFCKRIMEDLMRFGEFRRGHLPFGFTDVDFDRMKELGLSSARGALVQRSEQEDADAVLLENDCVIAFAGKRVENAAALRFLIAQEGPGIEVMAEVIREGKVLAVSLRIQEAFAEEKGKISDSGDAASSRILSGVRFQLLNDPLRNEFSLPDDLSGLLIMDVSLESPHAKRIRSGMVISEINRKEVHSFADALAALVPGKNNVLWVWEDGSFRYLPVKIPQIQE